MDFFLLPGVVLSGTATLRHNYSPDVDPARTLCARGPRTGLGWGWVVGGGVGWVGGGGVAVVVVSFFIFFPLFDSFPFFPLFYFLYFLASLSFISFILFLSLSFLAVGPGTNFGVFAKRFDFKNPPKILKMRVFGRARPRGRPPGGAHGLDCGRCAATHAATFAVASLRRHL